MKRSYHFHLATLAYVILAALVGVAAANRPNNLLVWVFGLMLAAVLLSGLISGLMLMGLSIVRLDPRRARVGEPMTVRYALHNRNRLVPTFALTIEERTTAPVAPTKAASDRSATVGASAWVLHVGPGETVHGEAIIWPTQRGRMHLEAIRVSSGFPFGLLRKSVTVRQPQEILVHPRTVALRPDLLRSLRTGGRSGQRSSGRVGAGEEYYGVREYRIGDSLRQIAWRRSGASDDLLSIERIAPSPPRVRVVLDLHTPTDRLRAPVGTDPRELEEQAISLAASVVRLAERSGDQVGLTIVGLRRPESFPLRNGHWHTQRLMAALAAIDLDGPRTDRLPLSLADAERAAIVVISADRADPGVVGAAGQGALLLTARQLADLAIDEDPSATDGAARRPDAEVAA